MIAHEDRDDGTYQRCQEWLGWLLMAAKMEECVLEEKRSWLARSNDFVAGASAHQVERPQPELPDELQDQSSTVAGDGGTSALDAAGRSRSAALRLRTGSWVWGCPDGIVSV